MRVILVDDEHLARALLRELLAARADIDIVAECANGFEAVKAIAELEPDLVFLDIQMPRLDGFEVAELAGARTRYLFVTAFDQFALRPLRCMRSTTCSSPSAASGWNRRWRTRAAASARRPASTRCWPRRPSAMGRSGAC